MVSELSHDGGVIWSTLAAPRYGLARAVARQRVLTVVIVTTVLWLLATALTLPSMNTEALAADSLRPDMTPHERSQAIETATKLNEVTTWALAALGPLTSAFFLAVGVWLGFWVSAAKTGFKATFAVCAHALLPQALKVLLMVPAAWAHAPISPAELPRLLPSSLSSLLPASLTVPAPALAALGAVDLFTLWSLGLLSAGMAKASGASKMRTWAILLVLFAAYVAVVKVVPSSGGFGPRGAS